MNYVQVDQFNSPYFIDKFMRDLQQQPGTVIIGSPGDYHAVSFVGYDQTGKIFKVRDSNQDSPWGLSRSESR
jgi:hypothetical protein